jgi:hypothetical protein
MVIDHHILVQATQVTLAITIVENIRGILRLLFLQLLFHLSSREVSSRTMPLEQVAAVEKEVGIEEITQKLRYRELKIKCLLGD